MHFEGDDDIVAEVRREEAVKSLRLTQTMKRRRELDECKDDKPECALDLALLLSLVVEDGTRNSRANKVHELLGTRALCGHGRQP